MSGYADARFITSADRPDQFLADEGAEVAFAGRSNAGKSSAINAIVARRDLARTSKTPGRTQLINFFYLSPGQRLVDLPGYGFARVPPRVQAHWRQLLESYFLNRHSLKGLFLAVDARRALSELDMQMLEWCETLGCPIHVLLTKADKLNRADAQQALDAAQKNLSGEVTAQLFSAHTHDGVAVARSRLMAMLRG